MRNLWFLPSHLAVTVTYETCHCQLFFLAPLARVANVSEVWKQGARSPLGGIGDESAGIAIPPLRICSYARLQLLQSLCPAAAAAIMILSRQMPEMRNSTASNQLPNSPSSIASSTVTADAWCPRALMEVDEASLLFFMPDGCVSRMKWNTGSVRIRTFV